MSPSVNAGDVSPCVAPAAPAAPVTTAPNGSDTPDWGVTDLQPTTLRSIFGRYPTGVAIVATRASDGRRVGLTINSFASLSLDPPLILWSLVRRSVSLPAFRDCAHFTISVLGSDQQELARRFASATVADKFEGAPVLDMPEGVPAIEGAVATLVCANDRCIDGGDHLLLFGRVLRVASGSGAPLVFHAGRFTVLPD